MGKRALLVIAVLALATGCKPIYVTFPNGQPVRVCRSGDWPWNARTMTCTTYYPDGRVFREGKEG